MPRTGHVSIRWLGILVAGLLWLAQKPVKCTGRTELSAARNIRLLGVDELRIYETDYMWKDLDGVQIPLSWPVLSLTLWMGLFSLAFLRNRAWIPSRWHGQVSRYSTSMGDFSLAAQQIPQPKRQRFLLTRNSIVIINAHQRKLNLSLRAATLPGIQKSPLYAKKLK